MFSTDALNKSALPRSGVQFFRAESKLRKEEFHFAFTGGVSSLLKADGTVLEADVWPPKFAAFEAEGERRAYVRSASDLVGQQRLGRSFDPAPVMAVISDSLPQAVLTPSHAARSGGDSTVLTLPFVASDNVTGKGQTLTVPSASVFPLRFRFRGQIDNGIIADTAGGQNGLFFRLKDITTATPFHVPPTSLPIAPGTSSVSLREMWCPETHTAKPQWAAEGRSTEFPRQADRSTRCGAVGRHQGGDRRAHHIVVAAHRAYREGAAARARPGQGGRVRCGNKLLARRTKHTR